MSKNTMNRRTFVGASAGVALGAAALPALATTRSAAAQDAVELRYVLWDANQLPAYQAVADQFMKENPTITITIEQLGWGDYWDGLTASILTDSAPDVFTDHLAKYPELMARGQLVDLQPLVDADNFDVNIYTGQLADLWTRDGARYGLPKDWDTIAVAYNADALTAAGIDPAIFEEWTWNPDDGGTFAETVARLTIDENGNNGLSADFDGTKVKQYGLANKIGDAYGQAGWSLFAASTGWRFLDAPWTPPYHLDDPRLAASIQNLADMSLTKKISAPEENVTSLGAEAMFSAGTAALVFFGSWMINWLSENVTFPFAFGRLPTGPESRICMFNGLADSIWSGTKHPDEAWQWVKYLGSEPAQQIVGSFGAVFPAIPAASETANNAFAEKGIDASPFLNQALQEGGTFLFPIADHAAEYTEIMTAAMQSIGLGQESAADALPPVATEINDLFA